MAGSTPCSRWAPLQRATLYAQRHPLRGRTCIVQHVHDVPLNLLQPRAQVGAQQVAHPRQLAHVDLHQQLVVVALLQQLYLLLLHEGWQAGCCRRRSRRRPAAAVDGWWRQHLRALHRKAGRTW